MGFPRRSKPFAERSTSGGCTCQVINERDILGTQLIRRNDELALLYEKLRIMQSTLEKGEVQYSNRLKVRHGMSTTYGVMHRGLGS